MTRFVKIKNSLVFLLVVLATLVGGSAKAVTYTWALAGGGSWATTTNWTPNGTPAAGDDVIFNVAGAAAVTSVPTISLNSITIGGAGIVTLSGITTAKVVTITGNVTVNNGGLVAGGLLSYTFAAGSFYNHARNGGTIPTATWSPTSTVNVTGITTTLPTFVAATLGNLTWNNAAQTATATAPTVAITVAGALNVNAGNFYLGTGAFTVTGNTTIANGATLTVAGGTGAKAFNGDFINNGTFTNSANFAISLGSNFQNNGTFTAGSGVYTFTTTGRTISGSSATTFGSITINTPIVITNNSTAGLTVSTALSGTGTLLQGTNAQLFINGTSGITTLTCTTNTPNTVTYGATSIQTVKGTTYHNLVINKASNVATAATGVVINNSFAINSGTFADGGFTVTGNAAATFTMAAGATYQTTRTAAPFFPTNFTTTNTNLDPGSTFTYAATSFAHTLPLLSTLPITQYPILGIAGSTIKTLAEPTTVYGLNISAATLTDGGFQITANASGPVIMANSTTLNLGSATTGTTFPLNAVTGNINLNVGSTVNYQSTQPQTIGSAPVYGNLTLTNASTKTLNGGTIVAGTFSMGASTPTFNANGQTLTLRGSATYTSGTFTATATNSEVRIENTTGNTYNFGTTIPLIKKVTMANSGVATLTNSIDVEEFLINTSANLTVSSCTLGITGTYSNSGTISLNGGVTSVLAMKGTTAQNLAIGGYTSSLVGNLVINNAAGVTLDLPINVTTISLNNGLLNTTSTNILQVNGLTAANIVGGNSTSYVNGPMRRLLPNGASVVSFVFPVGKGDYNPFTLNSPTTNAATVVVQAEVVDAVAGGTAATGFSAAPTPARYWQASASTSPANLTAIGSVRLQDTDMTITADNAIGRSATLTGAYSNFGGATPNSPAAGDLTTSITVPTALGFFKIGEKGSLCGTYTVGSGVGDTFPTLTEAITVLNGSNVTCNVFFDLTSNYTGAGETFPIVVNQLSYVGGPWTVTVRPQTGVTTTRTIAGDPGTGNALINLNGADNFVIDGVPGGSTGSNVVADGRILLRNTRTAATVGPTVLFDNDATNNTLKYLQIEGQNITTTSGTIVFGATAPALGNEGNTIAYCAIGNRADAPATFPTIAIYSVGNTTANRGNDNINITSNNIFNFWNAGAISHGILVGNYNSTWNISGNSFYQTGTRPSTTTAARTAIFINTGASGGDGFTVANNIIGGAQADGGGTAWTISGANTHTFAGISLNVNNATTAVASSVSGNVVRNFNHNSTSTTSLAPGVFSGIYVGSNGYNVSITNNTVGDTTGTGNITITRSASGGGVYGISNAANGFVTITGNRVGSFTITHSATTTQFSSFTGIYFEGGGSITLTRDISNNVVGSRNTANNISLGASSLASSAQSLYGIRAGTTGTGNATVANNIVANLTNSYTGTGATSVTHGIAIFPGLMNISGNQVYNLLSSAPSTGTGVAASLGGIILSQTSYAGHTIANNIIHSLENTSSGAVVLTGIFLNTGTSTLSNINANFIHSLNVASSSTSSILNGIVLQAGNHMLTNNMLRLGLKASDGLTGGTGNTIYGINELAGINYLYHNSIYIGGTGAATTNTFAFYSAAASGARSILNNIFWNARSSSSTGLNFAIRIQSNAGLTSDYNDLFANGTNGRVGQVNTTAYTTLADWRTGTAEDAASISGDPMFINPTGTAALVDLHIQAPPVTTQIEGTATNAGVGFDYDGQTRSALTPDDMGADAGDFEPIDLTAPTISFTDISGVCNSATSHTFSVTITDASGVNTTSGTAPRVYYKKSGDANDLTGWKFVESTTGSSPFSFTIDFSALNAGSVSAADVLQYFVVAQDQAPTGVNIGIANGTFAAAPASVALTSGAFGIGGTIKTFTILPCSGTVTVGTTGANYPSLTNPGGLFEAINATTLTGPLVANITTDLTLESGTVSLNQWSESGVGGYTVTIQSSAAAQRLITSTAAATTGLIRINGADRAIFNGGTGTNRYLLFRNTITNNAGASTFSFTNDASNNTINNCIIEGAAISTANGVISFGTGVATGNDNNTITNCDISDNGTTPYNAIYSVGTGTLAINNSGNNINNCNISDYHHPSGVSTGILLGTGNNSWTIQDNHFFQTASRTAAAGIHSAININNNVANQGGYVITGNFIGGSAADGSGTMTYTSTLAAQYAPIYLAFVPTLPASTVTNNIVDNISVSTISASSAGPGMFTGIYLGGAAAPSWTVTGNLIGDTTTTGSISVTLGTNSGGFVYGIRSESTGNPNISNNAVAGISVNATGSNANASLHGINFTAGSVTVNNNLIGSASIANSLLVTATATTNNGNIIGISGTSSGAYSATVSNNRVMNLRHSNVSTTTQITGIACSNGGQYSITGNTVRSISSPSGNTGNGTSSSVLGIMLNTGNTSAQTVSQNTVYDLANNGSAVATVTGIYAAPGSSASNVLSRNLVHSLLPSSSTSASAGVVGISINGPLTASNNMIRLGIDASGASITTAQPINGISLNNTSGATNVYFNTVYIGGSGVGTGTTGTTVAFRRISVSGTHNFRNNIFVNARSNASTGSKHYAYLVANNTGVTSDYNLFHAPGTGGVLFSINNGVSDITTLAGLQIGGGQNVNSGVDDPNLVNPTGTTSTLDLHITGITAADEAGIAIVGISVDFDGDDRTNVSTTPTDIGADATDATPKDIVPPAVSVTSVPTQAPCGGTLSVNITATVTDATSGVNTTTFPPTLWWRESTGTWASVAATSNTGNDWLFTLNLTGVTAGQTYQYYAAAQDLAATPNVGYSNYSATTPVHANTTGTPSVTNTSPASFTIVSATPLSGTVTVGSGGNYTSFNAFNSTGLFFDLMNRGLSGNLIVKVISDVNENGLYNVLGSIPEYCGSGYSVTIRPDSNLVRTISQSAGGNPMINFQGCQRIYIDGSFGGSGRYLTFAGRQSMPTFYINGNTQNVSIANCTIEGNNQLTNSVGPGVINFAGLLGSGTLITNITINNNIIRNRSDLAQSIANSPNTLINMGGLSATSLPLKSNITISNNEMFNFRENAINIRQNSSFSGIGDNITITGNKIYEPINYNLYQYVIWLEGGTSSKGHTISNNIIGGNALPSPGLTGTWSNNKADSEIWAIYTLNGGTNINDGVTISGNTIGNMNLNGYGYGNFIGIRNEFGYAKIENNTINGIANYGHGAAETDPSACIGIWNGDENETEIVGNVVSNIRAFYDVASGFLPYQTVLGIMHGSNFYLNGANFTNLPGGTIKLSNNQVFNLSSGSLNATVGTPDALTGIFCFPANGTTGNEVSGNQVYNLNCTEGWTNNANNTRIYGIGVGLGGYGATATGVVSNNKVYDMSNNSRANAPEVNGIVAAGGNWTLANNMISITNSDYPNGRPLIVGLLDWMRSGRTGAFYNNSVYIGGTVVGGSNSSYAYCRIPDALANVNGAAVTIRNNIFFNDRTGNSTNNIAIGNLGTLNTPSVGWNSDYNFLVTRNTGQVGRWIGTTSGDRTLAGWQTTTSGDANSKTATITTGTSSSTAANPAELFLNTAIGDLHVSITPPNDPWPYSHVQNQGQTLAALTVDIDGDNRPLGAAYDMGADEFTACATPVVTGNPTSPTICAGANTSVSVTATGSGVTYAWEVNTGSSWAVVSTGGVYSTATTATLNITAAPATMNGYQYRGIATNSCGADTSTVATLTVNAAPVVTAYNPSGFNNSICAGSNTLFGVTATGGSLTYQWQTFPNGGSAWANVTNAAPYSGVTSNELSIGNTPQNLDGYQYRVIVSGSCAPPDTSDVGILTVTGPVITAQPSTTTTVCDGASTTISATANVSNYQWQVSTNGGGAWSNLSNGAPYSNVTTGTLTINPASTALNNYQYRVVATNTSCSNTVNSDASVLTVNAAPTAVSVSGGGTFCGSATLTATGGTGGTIYWQNTTTGGTSTATASSSQSVTSSGTYYFRAQGVNGCWSTQGSATITILAAPNASTTWTGTVDSDWFKWDNWTNCVPGSITDVTIPSGAPNYPSVYGSNPVANSVTIQSGATLTLNGGRTLLNTDYVNNQGTLTMTAASTIQLGGNWTNTGTFNSGNGTVQFTGASNSTVNAGGTGTTQAFNNILVTKTGSAKVTLAASVKTNGNLQVNTGEFEVPAGLQALPTNVINNPSGTIRVKGTGQLRVEP